MSRNRSRFRDNVCVMYKSVDDLIQRNRSLIGRTKISNYADTRRKYFTRY